MKTCATCKFLGDAAPLERFLDEEPWEQRSGHRRCARVIHGNAGAANNETFAQPAVVTDGSGYAASLRVLPTFGCALHEPAGAVRFPVSPEEIARQLQALKVEIAGITSAQSRRFDEIAETVRTGGYTAQRMDLSLGLAHGEELDELARIVGNAPRCPGETDVDVRREARRMGLAVLPDEPELE